MKRTLNLEEAIAAVLRSSESKKDSTSGNLSDNEEGKEFLALRSFAAHLRRTRQD